MKAVQLSSKFNAKYVLKDKCEKKTGKCSGSKQYWLLPNGVKNKGFVIDTGCKQKIKRIRIKNTRNADCGDR